MTSFISAEQRRFVIARAGNCCEYCLLPQPYFHVTFHIEHIIAEKHGGGSGNENLCLSCPFCNGAKGSDIASIDWAVDEQIRPLFNPRKQRWFEHFRLQGAIIEGFTPEGRVTAFLLQFNIRRRRQEREILMRLNRYPCRNPAPTML